MIQGKELDLIPKPVYNKMHRPINVSLKMKAINYVKMEYPNAKCRLEKKFMLGGLSYLVYYIITDEGKISQGNTESKAWNNAKKFLIGRSIL